MAFDLSAQAGEFFGSGVAGFAVVLAAWTRWCFLSYWRHDTAYIKHAKQVRQKDQPFERFFLRKRRSVAMRTGVAKRIHHASNLYDCRTQAVRQV